MSEQSFPVQSTGRIAVPGQQANPVVLIQIAKSRTKIRAPHFLSQGTTVKLEFHVMYGSQPHRIRCQGEVVVGELLANNASVHLTVLFTQMGREDAHALANALHAMAQTC